MLQLDAHVQTAVAHYLKTAVDFVCTQGNKSLKEEEYHAAMQRYATRVKRIERLLDAAALAKNHAQVIEHGRTYMILHKRAFDEWVTERRAPHAENENRQDGTCS